MEQDLGELELRTASLPVQGEVQVLFEERTPEAYEGVLRDTFGRPQCMCIACRCPRALMLTSPGYQLRPFYWPSTCGTHQRDKK